MRTTDEDEDERPSSSAHKAPRPVRENRAAAYQRKIKGDAAPLEVDSNGEASPRNTTAAPAAEVVKDKERQTRQNRGAAYQRKLKGDALELAPDAPVARNSAAIHTTANAKGNEKQSRTERGRLVSQRLHHDKTALRDQNVGKKTRTVPSGQNGGPELAPEEDFPTNDKPVMDEIDSEKKKQRLEKGRLVKQANRNDSSLNDQFGKHRSSPRLSNLHIPTTVVRDGEDEDDELSIQDLIEDRSSEGKDRSHNDSRSAYYASVNDVPHEAPGAYRVGDEEESEIYSYASLQPPATPSVGASYVDPTTATAADRELERKSTDFDTIQQVSVRKDSKAEKEEKMERTTKEKKKKCLIIAGILVLVVIVAVGAGVGVSVAGGTVNENKDKDNTPTTPPVDTSPSQSPSVSLQPTRSGNEWLQASQDIDGLSPRDGFGQWVRLSGDAGTLGVASSSVEVGQPYVQMYRRAGLTWTPLGELFFQPVSSIVELSFDGLRMIIGTASPTGSLIPGRVEAFEWNGTAWNPLGDAITNGGTSDARSQFGVYASISGDGSVVAVTDYLDSGTVSNAGSLQMFRFDGASWIPLGQVIYGNAALDWLGFSVSLNYDGSVVAAGAIEGSGPGFAQIYELDETESLWVQRGSDLGRDNDDNSFIDFGSDLALSRDGNVIVVSDNKFRTDSARRGSVQVYEYDQHFWTQRGDTIIGDPLDVLGFSVAISGDGSIVTFGAPRFDLRPDAGFVAVVYWAQGKWIDLGPRIMSEEVVGEDLGYSVSISADGRTLAAGDLFNSGNGENSGSARVYELV